MAEEKNMNPVDEHLYKERKDFCVVALTGVLGSGFEDLTKVMTSKKSLLEGVRDPKCIQVPLLTKNKQNDEEHQDQNADAFYRLLFNRKYTICHNYISQNYAPYTIIKYNNALWYYTLRFFAKQISDEQQNNANLNTGSLLCEKVTALLNDKYIAYNFELRKENQEENRGTTYNRYQAENLQPSQVIFDIVKKENKGNEINWQELYNAIIAVPDFLTQKTSREDNTSIAEAFFAENRPFLRFCIAIKRAMLHYDYYLYCMFFWRLGICIRAKKDPSATMGSTKEDEKRVTDNNDGLFEIVHLITTIIKGYHKSDNLHGLKDGTRICIDSLRNSFEARYLQERFSAFYLINVYNEDFRSTLKKLVTEKNRSQNTERQKLIIEAINQLYKKEAKSEVEDGHLAMHDVDTCVSNAEIHITNRGNEEKSQSFINTHFYTLAEQWMKFAALIQRPGLFSPDTEERCMQIAYTAKFNSGCISRQVGAVITNKDGSIRTIGWNDPPQGQVPCGLRDVADLLKIRTKHFTPASDEQVGMMYSEYEIGNNPNYKVYADGTIGFKEILSDPKIKETVKKWKQENENISLPYCFKQCHTTWFEKERGNSFHQRAIHAEENAMMQMVRYGGESLKGGIIYVTASPCEICSKKLYQIGVRKIVFIDPYPGIAPEQVIRSGFLRPELVYYEGVYGASYFKLYSHFIDYKDELKVRGVVFPPKPTFKLTTEGDSSGSFFSKHGCLNFLYKLPFINRLLTNNK